MLPRSGLQVLDANGKRVTVTMGSYGIGVLSRGCRGRGELARRNSGLCGARAKLAPYDVHVWSRPARMTAVNDAADRIVAELEAAGLSVLHDDRRNRVTGREVSRTPSCWGCPTIIAVGRGLIEGCSSKYGNSRQWGDATTSRVGDIVARLTADRP